MSTYMYKKAFGSNQFGYGSAIAVFIILESMLVVGILNYIFTTDEDREERANMRRQRKARRERRRAGGRS